MTHIPTRNEYNFLLSGSDCSANQKSAIRSKRIGGNSGQVVWRKEHRSIIERAQIIETFMLIFFDESFRRSETQPDKALGILCGIAIPEKQLSKVVADVF
jgi:hypothetical protein